MQFLRLFGLSAALLPLFTFGAAFQAVAQTAAPDPAITAAPGPAAVAPLPPLEYTLTRPVDEILIYANMALLGEPGNPDYGFRLLTDPKVMKGRAVVQLLAKAVNAHPDYNFGANAPSVVAALVKEAAAGTASAILAVAQLQDSGINTPQDAVSAFKGYLKAAGLNNDTARELAAMGYATGKGTPVSKSKALAMVDKMAPVRRGRGYIELAELYANGPATVQDFELASELALKAGQADPLVGRRSVDVLRKVSTSSTVMEQIQSLLEAAARAGDVKAIAALNEEIDGKESDIKAAKALQLYKELAGKGNARAAKILSVVIVRSDNSADDRAALFKVLKSGADAGGVDAMKAVANCYLYAIGTATDFPAALSYYQTAANAGDTEAQYLLGLMYLNAIGTTQDLAVAKQWLQKSADSGNKMASISLGVLGG